MRFHRMVLWMFLAFTVALGAPTAFGQASSGLDVCQKTMAKESAKYVRLVVRAADKCLGKMSADVVQGGATVAESAGKRAELCATVFAPLASTGSAKELATGFVTKVGS